MIIYLIFPLKYHKYGNEIPAQLSKTLVTLIIVSLSLAFTITASDVQVGQSGCLNKTPSIVIKQVWPAVQI